MYGVTVEEYGYLIKEGVVSPLDPCPVGLSTHTDLHHRLDVVARQLTGLNDPNTDLKEEDSPSFELNRNKVGSWPQY